MENQSKLRIICLYRILSQYTNEAHPLSTNQLIRRLAEEYRLDVNRNTLGKDLELMMDAGLGIRVIHSTQNKYYFDGQTFTNGELKLLMDAVASSRFIPEKRSKELIKKLGTLTNVYEQETLHRNVSVAGRVKTESETGYENVDRINSAIDRKERIAFTYVDYTSSGKKILRHDGEKYLVSPYALVWDGDYYYLIGYAENRGKIENFRLDRIHEAPENMGTAGYVKKPRSFSLEEYRRTVFRMFGTDESAEVTLVGETFTLKGFYDQFGEKTRVRALDEDHYTATVRVCPSPTFYRWVFVWGGAMKITAPENVREEYREMCRKGLE